MSHPFEETVINGVTLRNRFVRSATWEGLAAPGGYVTEKFERLMVELARGKVGLIITSHAYISPEGIAAPGQLGIYTDEHVAGLAAMVDKVHQAGGRIALQVSHGGRYALKLPETLRVGPSPLEARGELQCREMTEEEVHTAVRQFGDAARRAKRAGFDGIQFHAAHGYLLSAFLTPAFNKRSDVYGGPLANRARFLLEAVGAAKREAGDKFLVMVKLNCQDFMEGGFTVEEMLEVASDLEKAGLDALEMSGGNHVAGIFGEFFPARPGRPKAGEAPYYLDEARRFKERVRIPLMLVGGFRSLDWVQRVLSEGVADYISLSRPLIREPGLVARWESGDLGQSPCISDNGCFAPGLKEGGIYCTVAARQRGQA